MASKLAAGKEMFWATRAVDAVIGPEQIAQRFHEVYEELAPIYGWQTQERSRVPWDDVPPANKRMMVKVLTRLIREGTISTNPR
jgi:hypothetical protein